jgi:hypothetical protein
MADSKISALPASTTPLAGTEVLPIVQSGATVKVAVSDLTAGRAVSASSLTASTGNLTISTGNKGVTSNGALFVQNSATVAAGGTLDITLDTAGFVGIVSLSYTRDNFPLQSRRIVFAAACYGTTYTSTSLHQQDGLGGGPAYTLTVPSAGTLRYTDTSGDGSTKSVYLTFSGSRSAG